MTLPYVQPGIMNISPYIGGETEITGIDRIIKLSSNESALGPSLQAIDAYNNLAHELHRYPDGNCTKLRKAIAKTFCLDAERIICGSGSDEIISLLCQAYAGPGDEVLHTEYGFLMYPISARACGATPVSAIETSLTANVDTLLAAVTERTRILFIANPNNPTGTYLNNNELRLLMSKIPSNIVVVIDTAYAEFADADDYDKTFSLADEYNNVLITRTFSKAYSLAGLRLGWGYASSLLINMIKKLRPPFNLPPGTIAAGIAALNDENHLEKSVIHNSSIKYWFIDELNNLGFKAYNTQANFIFVIIPERKNQSASIINDYLLSKGIAVRYLLSYGLKNALRITLGTKEELNKTLEILKEFVENNG